MKMKYCSHCKQTQPLEAFHVDRKQKDGHQVWCKRCICEINFAGKREQAIVRDHERCVLCGMTRQEHYNIYQRDITVDHIDGSGCHTSKEKKNNTLENLRTLCLKCHGLEDIRRSPNTHPKRVVQLLHGKIINTFASTMEAQRTLGIGNPEISKACRGIKKTAGGYCWNYLLTDQDAGKRVDISANQ